MKDRDVKRTETKKASEVFEGQTISIDGQRLRVDRRTSEGQRVTFTELGYGKRKPRRISVGRTKKVEVIFR